MPVLDLNNCFYCNEHLSSQDFDNRSCSNCEANISRDLRNAARDNPQLYYAEVVRLDGSKVQLVKIAENLELAPIVKLFKQFAVTNDGIECTQTYYNIAKHRIDEDDWVKHMSEKTWVDIKDFTEAFEYARKYFQ